MVTHVDSFAATPLATRFSVLTSGSAPWQTFAQTLPSTYRHSCLPVPSTLDGSSGSLIWEVLLVLTPIQDLVRPQLLALRTPVVDKLTQA